MNILKFENSATMSSLEIAEITGKNHANVLRDIRGVLDEVGIAASRFEGSYLGGDKISRLCYNLPKREFDLILTGYSAKYRLALIDHMIDLELKVQRLEISQFNIQLVSNEILQLVEDQALQIKVQDQIIRENLPEMSFETQLLKNNTHLLNVKLLKEQWDIRQLDELLLKLE